MHYLLLILLLQWFALPIHSRKHGSSRGTHHSLPKRVNVAKKEELLGEDTSKIDEAEYKLQSMVSPELQDSNRFFNKPPSKEIGGLRVDTMSPAQVSFIQSSTQWHKYYKPSTSSFTSNIYPEDPVLFPGYKPNNGRESSDTVGYAGGLEGLGNEGVPRHHHIDNEWNTNSYGSYGDTQGYQSQKDSFGDTDGYQPQKEYESNPPFMDKSWMNSKSEGRDSSEGYESFDGKTLAVPEPKNDQDEMPGGMSRFSSRSHELLGAGGGLGSLRQHSSMLGDDKASLLSKLADLKENGVVPQEQEEKVFFNGQQKLLQESNVASPPLDQLPGPSGGLGTALAEELLQKNRAKFRDEGQSTNILQDLHEANSELRSGGNDAMESEFLSKPMFDVKGIQRTNVYGNSVFDNDRGHLVLIRRHQVKERAAKKHATEHKVKLKNTGKKDPGSKRNCAEGKTKHIVSHSSDHKLSMHNSKLKATKKSIASVHKKLCKRCNSPSPLKKLSVKIHGPHKDR